LTLPIGDSIHTARLTGEVHATVRFIQGVLLFDSYFWSFLRDDAGTVPFMVSNAGVAQLVEHLICNQAVAGSSPIASSRNGFRQ
jgi:hypothetical protein